MMRAGSISSGALAAICLAAPAQAEPGISAFADHCFSPFMTGDKAATVFGALRHDFYDLDPFSAAAPTPAAGAAVTPGTDRRCEVSFDGDAATQAATAAVDALTREGITTQAALPLSYQATTGTALLAARRLNPRKIAVVHVGTRPGPNGVETFMNVERLPLAENRERLPRPQDQN